MDMKYFKIASIIAVAVIGIGYHVYIRFSKVVQKPEPIQIIAKKPKRSSSFIG